MSRPDYEWANEASRVYTSREYFLPGVTTEQRVLQIAAEAKRLLEAAGGTGHAEWARKFEHYMARGYYSLATPIWANFGSERGLPISCFGCRIEDSSESIIDALAEAAIQTKHGGGTSADFGDVRPRGSPIQGGRNGESFGSVNFASSFDNMISVFSQGSTRRGQFAGYWPITHGDIYEVLSMRSENSPIKKLSFGVTVTNSWMEEMIGGDSAKRDVWAKILQTRANTGYPYVVFIDSMNRAAPAPYGRPPYEIRHSNLCTEIALPDGTDESFVCCLSSMNVLYYDEWKHTDAVAVLTRFLDAVITSFVERARNKKYLGRAVRFAERHRALGLGWVGWHSYLQSRMTPVSSTDAYCQTVIVAKTIQRQAWDESTKMAVEFGEPEALRRFGRRNATLTAIAPTTSSAFILGQVSPGIEPFRDNYHVKDLQKGKFHVRNPFLDALLNSEEKLSLMLVGRPQTEVTAEYAVEAVWASVLAHGGSVQHLPFLSREEKDVFRTFGQISQRELVIQAAARQKYLDQSQSLNLMIHPSVPVKDVNALMIDGWKLGIKSFYYQHSVNAAQEAARDILACSACES